MATNDLKLQSKIIKEQHLDAKDNQKVLNHLHSESMRFFIFVLLCLIIESRNANRESRRIIFGRLK